MNDKTANFSDDKTANFSDRQMYGDVDALVKEYIQSAESIVSVRRLLTLAWLKGAKHGITTTAAQADAAFQRLQDEVAKL